MAAQVTDVFRDASQLWRNWQQVFPRCDQRDCRAGRNLWFRLWRKYRGVRMRNTWYCTIDCFEKAAGQLFVEMMEGTLEQPEVKHRVPLGLLMVSRGQLQPEQLGRALEEQRLAGHGKLGHWLQQLGFSTEQQVTASLALQWACPVFPLQGSVIPACAQMLPLPLLEAFRMMPVYYAGATRSLYIGFTEKVDYLMLSHIERMLDCKTQPCVVSPKALARILERLGEKPRASEVRFAAAMDADEMARITRGYVAKLGAEEVRSTAYGDYLWLRLLHGRNATSLLFRRARLLGTAVD